METVSVSSRRSDLLRSSSHLHIQFAEIVKKFPEKEFQLMKATSSFSAKQARDSDALFLPPFRRADRRYFPDSAFRAAPRSSSSQPASQGSLREKATGPQAPAGGCREPPGSCACQSRRYSGATGSRSEAGHAEQSAAARLRLPLPPTPPFPPSQLTGASCLRALPVRAGECGRCM